jgi:hypothetical protein
MYNPLRTSIEIQELIESQPLYIKDEGPFFSFWLAHNERIDLDMKEWPRLRQTLDRNNIVYESEV